LEGEKIKERDGIGWNVFHYVPLHSIEFLNIQTMEHHSIPLHSIPFHPIPSIQTYSLKKKILFIEENIY
jgi:hypothetical protein